MLFRLELKIYFNAILFFFDIQTVKKHEIFKQYETHIFQKFYLQDPFYVSIQADTVYNPDKKVNKKASKDIELKLDFVNSPSFL